MFELSPSLLRSYIQKRKKERAAHRCACVRLARYVAPGKKANSKLCQLPLSLSLSHSPHFLSILPMYSIPLFWEKKKSPILQKCNSSSVLE